MSRKQQMAEDSGPNVPAYIVTFSDMVTLLLTFFVMLLSLASVQDPELFNVSQGAFVQDIKNAGLGMLWGMKAKPSLGESKPKYFISDPEEKFAIRTIDAKEEKTRRMFGKVTQTMGTTRSKIVAKTNNFSVTDISFPPGEAQLNRASKKFLSQFAANLPQDAVSDGIKLYVLGLANDERSEEKQWILSAKRAQVVADFLNDILPSHIQSPVYSWGAGAGGDWVRRDSPISRESQILIAVLSEN